MAKSASAEPKRRRVASQRRRSQESVLFGFLTVAYVLDAVGLLDPSKKTKLDMLNTPDAEPWGKTVEDNLRIDKAFVRSVYEMCENRMEPEGALIFLLRGLDCPDYMERLREALDADQ